MKTKEECITAKKAAEAACVEFTERNESELENAAGGSQIDFVPLKMTKRDKVIEKKYDGNTETETKLRDIFTTN